MIQNQNEMHKLSKVKNGANMQLTINSFMPLFPEGPISINNHYVTLTAPAIHLIGRHMSRF